MPLEGFPANGIVVRDEKNIQIEKEELYISRTKIEVSYVFKNHSGKDIVTEVAFPIPLHSYDPTGIIKYPLHGDFTVEVNGTKIKHREITHAILNGKDYTKLLTKLKVSFKDFECVHSQNKVFDWYFKTLSKSKQKALLDNGLVVIDNELEQNEPYYLPAWSVETTYHWSQIFPANKTTSIKHSYTPNASHTPIDNDYKSFVQRDENIDARKAEWSDLLCLNSELAKWVKDNVPWFRIYIVDYILTTANHWKKPIKGFHLIIEADTTGNERVSTCFEKERLIKINDRRYEMTINDFVPDKEISVFFLN
ncbi:MAG: DUF4424 family protein [Nitrospirota bacterium]